MIFTSDQVFFDKIGEKETKRYFDECYKFICNYKNLGEKNIISAIIVAKLLTRLPMKRGERLTVFTYIGVIILFFINGIITPFHFSSLTLVSTLKC